MYDGYAYARRLTHTSRAAPDTRAPKDPWTTRSRCIGHPTAMFFPGSGRSPSAKRVCAQCPVRRDCLLRAMRSETGATYRYGIFGGLTARERVELAAMGWLPEDPTPPVAIDGEPVAA